MKASLPIIAFFSIILTIGWLSASANNVWAQSSITTIAPAQIQPATQQVTQQASITLLSPKGGETFINGNRYPVSWHAAIPQLNPSDKLYGEIRLIDQNAATKKDLLIATLNDKDLAKGSYTFLAGEQTDFVHGHKTAPQGLYKIRIDIKATPNCGPNAKCALLFEVNAMSNGAVTFKY